MSQPASSALSSMGYKLQVKISSTYTDIYECHGFDGPNPVSDDIDITTLGSPGGAEEILPGVIRMGTVSFTMHDLPSDTTHQYLETARKARTKEDFLLTPSGAGAAHTVQFFAYVKQYKRTAAVNQAAKVDVVLRLTGDITVA